MDPRRSRPLTALRARLNALETTNDPSGFRTDEVLAEIEELLPHLVTADGVDLQVLSSLGTVHYVRAAAAGSREEGLQDWQLSVTMLWPICLSQPDAVAPAVLNSFLQVRGEPLPEGDERAYQHAEALSDLSMLLLGLQQVGNPHCVQVAIGLLRGALTALPADRPSRAIILCNLGFALIAERKESTDPDDFDEVVELFRESVGLMPDGHPHYVRATYGLAAGTRAKAILSGNQELFDTAIELYRTAVGNGPSIADALDLMSDFAEALTIQAGFKPDSRIELLREAIGIQREIMGILPERAPILQAQLGKALLEAREAGAGEVTIGEAVEYLEQAATGFPQDSAELAETMSLLYRAYAVRTREESIKRQGPKEKALDDLMSRSIPRAPGADPEDPAGIMAVLAKLIGLMPGTDDSRHAQLMDFAATVAKYPLEAGLLEVQAKGMAVVRQQVAHLSPAEQHAELLRMANAPEEPIHTMDTTGLDEVADLLDQVLAGPQDELETVGRTLVQMSRNQLGLILAAASGDKDQMVELTHDVLQTLPDQMAAVDLSVSMVEPMIMLSSAMMSPFESLRVHEQDARIFRERLAEHDDLETRKALTLTLFMHFQLTRDEYVFAEAVTNARIVTSATSPPDARTVAIWASAAATRAHSGSIDGDESGGGMAGMASNQAVRSIIRNDGPGALEEIEAGRAVMLSSAVNARRELENLRKVDAGLAAEITDVRQRVRDVHRPGITPTPQDMERVRALAAEWSALIERIKGLPDFDRFMVPLPMGLSDLKPAAAHGPIVTINVHAKRCDAIVLGTEGVDIVALPDFHKKDLRERADEFNAALYLADVDEREAVLRATLAWMWDVVAEPVLDRLEFSDTPAAEWPRLWWLPTDALNFLPLHAAGRHDQPGMSVMDRVVSSYTPTIRALMYSRAGSAPQWRTALAVAMPETPGHADLPATRVEAESLASRMPGPLPVIGPQATRASVLHALPHANIAHFACHASSDPADPSTSHLLLHDGPLDVATISRLSLESAELAYLSACATARGGVRYANEAVHVASAFQLAGFSQVVATLWEIGDSVAAAAASNFHHEISTMINDPVRIPGAAILHKVTRRMRDAWPEHPSTWAAYVHSGS